MTKPALRMRGVSSPPRSESLERRLAGAWGPVFAYEKLGSAMDMAHELAAEGAEEGTLVFAVQQEQGRGRQGRTWASPEGGAYFALIVRPLRSPGETPQLSLLAGLAAAESVQALSELHPSIRWPNDVLLKGKKLAGILVEQKKGGVVVGIGINVTSRPEDLPESAVSLAAAMAAKPGPEPRAPPARPGVPGRASPELVYQLTLEVCRRFGGHYRQWAKQGFGPFRDILRPWLALFGHPVHVSAGSDYFEGTAQDLDEQGRLVVRLDSGVQKAFEMGEVALLR